MPTSREGIAERDLDRMVIDLAEPWTVLAAAAEALRPGGVLIVYVPTVMQVKQFVDQARRRLRRRSETCCAWHVQAEHPPSIAWSRTRLRHHLPAPGCSIRPGAPHRSAHSRHFDHASARRAMRLAIQIDSRDEPL